MAVIQRMSFEQFMAMEETKPASEWACGEVFQKPMADVPHAAIQLFLAAMLYPYLTRTGLGRAYTELRYIFGPPGQVRIFVPDLVYVARERLPTQRFLYAPPDLAIEILSPDHHTGRTLSKVQFYLLNGVRLVWVIDPPDARVIVLAPGAEPQEIGAGDVLDGGDVLPGFSVPVDDIFAQAEL
jgi:Uma2 family endonuclease